MYFIAVTVTCDIFFSRHNLALSPEHSHSTFSVLTFTTTDLILLFSELSILGHAGTESRDGLKISRSKPVQAKFTRQAIIGLKGNQQRASTESSPSYTGLVYILVLVLSAQRRFRDPLYCPF